MKISINAPSYKRANGVDVGKYIPNVNIWVCETEYDEYVEANPDLNIIPVPAGVQGNLCRIRNYILDTEFRLGFDAVCLVDDDLAYIGYFEKNARVRLEVQQVEDFIRRYAIMADEFGIKLVGVNVGNDKQFYREYTPFNFVAYIGGPFSIHIKNDLRYDERLPLKEDYDLSLQHLNKYRKVLRLNKFFYSVKQGGSGSGQTGGCAVIRNLEKENQQFELLQKKWGSKIVKKHDSSNVNHVTTKVKKFDLNPILNIPIKGV